MLKGNILDYIDWRGDLSFEQSPLNEVDGLILSVISYADFHDIVPEGMEEEIELGEAVRQYFKLRDIDKEKQTKSMTRNAPDILGKIGSSERFKNLRLANYVNLVDESRQEQFSAISIILDKKNIFISYRGTDDNIVGWKEDFNMSFLEEVPAQRDALEYLNRVADLWRGKFYLGGHSKGGNLAVYAAINSSSQVKKRIRKIFNNDGPGFSEKTVDSDEYRMMKDRIQKVVPHSSIVGMLFNHGEELTVVSSSESAAYQHNALSWEVIGNHFAYMDGISELGNLMDKTVTAWLDTLDEETRMQSIDTIFSVLQNAGVKTLADISGDNMKTIHSVLLSYGSLDSDVKKMLANTFKELLKAAKQVRKSEQQKDRLFYIEKKN